MSRNRVAVFLGAPGVGKGTYASRVCRQLGLRHVVAGDLIRAEIAAGSAIGNQVRAASQAGKLVDDRIVTSLVATALHTALSTESCAGVVLDGFPRTVQQARTLEAGDSTSGIMPTNVSAAIQLKLDDEICLLKLAGRRTDARTGEGYNVSYIRTHGLDLPPMLPEPCVMDGDDLRCAHGVVIPPNSEVTCAKCTAHLVARADDNAVAWRVRFAEHHAMEEHVLAHYQAAGILSHYAVEGIPSVCLPGLVDLVSQKLGMV